VARRRWNPTLHPRDRKGRFTRSATKIMDAAAKARAQQIADGFKPRRGVAGPRAGDYLNSISTRRGGRGSDAVGRFFTDRDTFQQVQQALRAGRDDDPLVRELDAAEVELPDDLVVSRRVPAAMFGDVPVEDLAGMQVRDAAYSPVSLATVRGNATDVRMRIAVPAGTRALVSPDTGELALDRDLGMAVTSVERNSAGGWDMYLVVLPREDADIPGRRSSGGGRGAAAEPQAADDADGFRAQLMRMRVPELRQQARDRGLRPGRARKSQLVDMIVADEFGNAGSDRGGEGQDGRSGTVPQAGPGVGVPAGGSDAAGADQRGGGEGRDLGAAAAAGTPGGGGAGAAADQPGPAGPAQSHQQRVDAAAADIRAAVADLAPPGDYIMLSRVRKRLGDRYTRDEVDDALRMLAGEPDFVLVPESNQKALSDEERAGAIVYGAQTRHLIANIAPQQTPIRQLTTAELTRELEGSDPLRVTQARAELQRRQRQRELEQELSTAGIRRTEEIRAELRRLANEPLPTSPDPDLVASSEPDTPEPAAAADPDATPASPDTTGASAAPEGAQPEPAAPDTSPYRPGRDVTGDADLLERALDATGRHRGSADPLMGGLSEQLGFDGLPEHGDPARLDQEIDAGGIELWRGVQPHTTGSGQTKSAQSMVDDYRNGPVFYGFGTVGNGVYTSNRRETAEQYGGGPDGAVQRIVLRADARTIDSQQLAELHERWQAENPDGPLVLADPGRFAMALGYDAIIRDLSAEGLGSDERYVVVLNRTATLVEADSPRAPLAERVRGGVVRRETLSGGQNARTELVTFADGSRGVFKAAKTIEGTSARDQQDAEELAAKVMQAVGLKAPEVYRPSARRVYMDYVEGRVAATLPREGFRVVPGSYNEDQYLLMGLADTIIENYDRNIGNWIVGDNGDIYPIDHGFAFHSFGQRYSRPEEAPRHVDKPSGVFSKPWPNLGEWADNDMAPEDIAVIRRRLENLRPEFERLGHPDWFEAMMTRLNHVAEHATGTRRRVT